MFNFKRFRAYSNKLCIFTMYYQLLCLQMRYYVYAFKFGSIQNNSLTWKTFKIEGSNCYLHVIFYVHTLMYCIMFSYKNVIIVNFVWIRANILPLPRNSYTSVVSRITWTDDVISGYHSERTLPADSYIRLVFTTQQQEKYLHYAWNCTWISRSSCIN